MIFPLGLILAFIRTDGILIHLIIPSIPSGEDGGQKSISRSAVRIEYEAPHRVHSYSKFVWFVFRTWGYASKHRPTRNGYRSAKTRLTHEWRRVCRPKVSIIPLAGVYFNCFLTCTKLIAFRVNRGMIPNWLWNSLRQPADHHGSQERVTYQRMARETSKTVAEKIQEILDQRNQQQQNLQANPEPYFRVYSK